MRRPLPLLVALWCLACGGLDGPEVPPAPTLPRGFDATVAPAASKDLPQRRCDDGQGHGWTWTPDGRFEATTPTAKFAGDWRIDGPDLLWVTMGPIGARCSAARWLSGPGIEALLCAEGAIACRPAGARPLELIDAGGGAEVVRRVAERLVELDPAAVAFQGGSASGIEGLEIAWQGGGVQHRAQRLAEGFAAKMGPVRVVEDPDARSPIVVRVGRL